MKSGESKGSSAADASMGGIFAASGSSFGGVPCLIMSQSRPSFWRVFTRTHSPRSRSPAKRILYSSSFSSSVSYVPVSQIFIVPAP